MDCKTLRRELIQLAVSVKRYISSPENGLEMVMIGLVLWILTQNTEENVSFVPISHVFPLVVPHAPVPHCNTCNDGIFDLCTICYKEEGHMHPMEENKRSKKGIPHEGEEPECNK